MIKIVNNLFIIVNVWNGNMIILFLIIGYGSSVFKWSSGFFLFIWRIRDIINLVKDLY